MANTNKVARVLPTLTVDGIEVANRGGRYGENYVIPLFSPRIGLADEGSYFVAMNPTPGTGLATIAAPTTLVDTSPFLMLLNNDVAGQKRAYLDFIKLIVTAAGTAGASLKYNCKIDNGVGRYTSGATLTAAPVNVNMDSSVAAVCAVKGGPLVAAAATAAVRLLGGGVFKTGIPVIGDTYILTFGASEGGVGSAVATINSVIFNHPPVVIGPQQTFLFHLWLPSQSGASSYEVEMGWVER